MMITIIMMLLILKINAAKISIIWLKGNIHTKVGTDNIIVTVGVGLENLPYVIIYV